jgi:hypothetical protein
MAIINPYLTFNGNCEAANLQKRPALLMSFMQMVVVL